MLNSTSLKSFNTAGFALIEQAIAASDIAQLEKFFPELAPRVAGARAQDFSVEACAWIDCHKGLPELASQLLGAPTRVSRLQAFDKCPQSNWFVPWHQDRAENGVDRPIDRLQRTVALRLHLDNCGLDNGPLEVLPGTHAMKRLEAAAIARIVSDTSSQVCLARRGDIIAMRPLLVHRSLRARIVSSRRVVHIEFEPVMRN